MGLSKTSHLICPRKLNILLIKSNYTQSIGHQISILVLYKAKYHRKESSLQFSLFSLHITYKQTNEKYQQIYSQLICEPYIILFTYSYNIFYNMNYILLVILLIINFVKL